jgi:hypothetical protein
MPNQSKHRFPIGTQYKTRGKFPRLCTVTDQLTVTNSKGEIVKTYYHSTHEFCGQLVTNTDVCDTTIAMGVSPEVLKAVSNA